METSASFEARSAPSPYSTTPTGTTRRSASGYSPHPNSAIRGVLGRIDKQRATRRAIKREDAARATSSEAQPHRQLCLPCRVSACDQPCGHQRIFDTAQSGIHNPVRKSEIHPIKDIEQIDADFSAH